MVRGRRRVDSCKRVLGRDGPVGRRAEAGERDAHDAGAVDRGAHGVPDARVVERRARHVEDEARRRSSPDTRSPRASGRAATSGAIVGEMPATSRSPLTRPANLVVGSSTTATMKRPQRAAGRPATRGRHRCGRRSSARRRGAARKTNGPLPTGAVAKASRRKSARGTVPEPVLGDDREFAEDRWEASASGRRATSVSVVSSCTSTRSSQASSPARGEPVAGSRAASRVKATSRAVVGDAVVPAAASARERR